MRFPEGSRDPKKWILRYVINAPHFHVIINRSNHARTHQTKIINHHQHRIFYVVLWHLDDRFFLKASIDKHKVLLLVEQKLYTMPADRFTEQLKQAAGDQWNRVINHKFCTELASNTIDRNVLKKYLIQDHRFLDAFVVLLGSIVAHARSLEDRIPACQFLALVTSTENTYFERCFEKLGCTAEERARIPDAACTAGFCNLMREVALQGSLAEMLSVICVCVSDGETDTDTICSVMCHNIIFSYQSCALEIHPQEWSYLSWADLVKHNTVRDDFVTYEWVDLHSGKDFEELVEYLRGLLDKEGKLINDAERDACKKRFLQAVQLEEDFFNMPYGN